MSESVNAGVKSAKAGAAPAATPQQDSWLNDTLGLDVGSYGQSEEPEAGGFFGDIAKTAAKVVGAIGSPLAAIGEVVQEAAETIGETVVDVGKAIVKLFEPPPPVKRAELGPAQTTRATKLLDKMPPEDKKKVQDILDAAKPDEAKYVQKALASKHSAAEIDEFYKKIKGKDAAWLDKNLHVTGESDGTGIRQQWHDSCGPTTTQAMKAELDPIYALKLRSEAKDVHQMDETDGTKVNPKMAEEQRSMLVGEGGIAVNRDDPDNGKGIPLTGLLNKQSDTTGFDFKIEGVTDDNVDAELGEIDKSIAEGLPVPMRVAGAGTGGHFVLVTGMDPGPPRRYSIHDPWDGKIVTVTDKQIKDKNFDIAGWNKVSHIYKPSAKPDAGP